MMRWPEAPLAANTIEGELYASLVTHMLWDANAMRKYPMAASDAVAIKFWDGRPFASAWMRRELE